MLFELVYFFISSFKLGSEYGEGNLSIISFLFIFVSSIELRISDCQNVLCFVLGILNFDGDQDDTGVTEKSV